jgi:hypothetical protein
MKSLQLITLANGNNGATHLMWVLHECHQNLQRGAQLPPTIQAISLCMRVSAGRFRKWLFIQPVEEANRSKLSGVQR